ncbi:crinkler family protein [Gigaspora margarita]|uniref:Crinkler family protein n=1 Tax=Gigaspora margarita TaxID=4874 RepID=A0A8H3X4B3_GIGMA|nr:crinkler family protein [Gigaspora margarita]
MSTITLNCLVVGENPYDNAFAVEIDTTKLVSFFKKAIKEELRPKFEKLSPNDIKLWRVEISLEEENEKLKLVNTKTNVNIKEELEGVELKSLSKISKHFTSQPADEHIHIIVQRPVETKEVHCTATYGRKSEKFLWAVTRGQITLSALKTRLRTCFTFPDGTEDEHIVINRESGKERIRLVDDEDLACIIWSQGFKVDLPIVIDTSQQPFSSWRFDKMKTLFGLKADDYNELPTFVGGVKDTPEDIRNEVLGEFLRLHKTSQHITSANEATRCEYISRIIYGVASIYGGDIKVYPQYEISGSHGKGPVDWAIKIGNIIITITEAKREDINQGIAQNAIQLQTSIQRNPKKRSYDTACLHEDVMYGIVSTAVDWVIIKLVSSNSENNNSEGKVEVLLSSLSPSPLPINKAILTHDDLVEPIKDLFGQIKWVFDRQFESQKLLKRVKTE